MRRVVGVLLVVSALATTALADRVVLTDGSAIVGTVKAYDADTLTFVPSFGGTLSIHKSRIARIEFGDGEQPSTPTPTSLPATEPDKPSGTGSITVSFRDRKLSSKIELTRKDDEDTVRRAGDIQLLVVVDGKTLHEMVDDEIDKIIYKGPVKQFKNVVELEDVTVAVPSGEHNVQVFVRNRGVEDHSDKFEDILNLALDMPGLVVSTGGNTRVVVGVDRGRLRMGSPTLVRVQ